MGLQELRRVEADPDSDLWGRRVLRGLRYGILLSLALWGAIALGLVLYLRPVALGSGGLVSVVPPGAVTFCIHQPSECQRAPTVSLPEKSMEELRDLNFEVNTAITYSAPERTDLHGLADWQVLADAGKGPCIDYALSKRHRLIALGYPAGAFSVAILHIAGMPADEYHAVLLARVENDVVVLDSRWNEVRDIEGIGGYEWFSYSAFGDLLDWKAGRPPNMTRS